MLKRQWTALVLLLLLLIAGCGGGGASSGGTTAATAGLFLTSGGGTRSPGLSSAYDHIWVTIKKVTFDGTKGAVVAYNDATGAVIDLKTLRDVNGAKFSLLGTMTLPADTYSDVKVVLSKDLSLVATGQSTAVAAVFAGFDVPSGTKELVKTFAPAKAIGADFCLDFDISSWSIDNGVSPPQVTATLEESDETGISGEDRHVPDAFFGTLSALAGAAPTQTFTFTAHEGFSANVVTTAATSIFSSDGALNPVLANGQHVLIKGVFDVTTHTLNATSIMIVIGNPSETHASGVPSAGDAVAGTFSLTVHEVEDFVPAGVTIVVATTPTTKFFNEKGTNLGVTDFFAALATATNVEVNGSFDAGTQTMTALSVRLEGDTEPDLAQVHGAVSNGIEGAMTFDIVATEFEGMNITHGSTVHVLLTNTTELIGPDRAVLTLDAFFTLLTTATGGEVEGTYDSSTQVLTATRAKLNTAAMHDRASVDGTASDINTGAWTFSLTVVEWEDASLAVGDVIGISTNGNTVYRDAGGNVITQNAFFTAAAAPNARIRVEGPLTDLTMVAGLARILPAPG